VNGSVHGDPVTTTAPIPAAKSENVDESPNSKEQKSRSGEQPCDRNGHVRTGRGDAEPGGRSHGHVHRHLERVPSLPPDPVMWDMVGFGQISTFDKSEALDLLVPPRGFPESGGLSVRLDHDCLETDATDHGEAGLCMGKQLTRQALPPVGR
jgi:hypothetical protein